MTLAYIPRLLCISLAAYLLIHLALRAMVSLLAGPALRRAAQIHSHRAARLLLALRLLPAAGAVFVVAAICLPSYLWLEPSAPSEHVGFACLAAAALSVAMWTVSIARGLRAFAATRRFLRRGPGAGPLLALGGIVRPRLIVSPSVWRALPAEELAAALRHERAHWAAHDNLKRLSILLAPGSRKLEQGWRKFAEYAADDRAAAGSPQRSCALAAALVHVARLTADMPPVPLAACLLGDPGQLSARVDRLLRPGPPAPPAARPILQWGAVLLAVAPLAAVILQPAVLYSVHLALEHLVG